jgi:hypothetical protein
VDFHAEFYRKKSCVIGFKRLVYRNLGKETAD